jgi:phage protein D
MTKIGKDPRGTSWLLSFPTLRHTTTPAKIELIQNRDSHDVLSFEFPNQSETWFSTVKTGVPIRFEWKQGARTNSWIGYVYSISGERGAQKKQPMKVTCVSASFVLKKKANRVFINKTIPEIAQIIAQENNLALDTEKVANLIRYSQLSISGKSYWEWLRELGERIGFGLVATGSTLIFKPIDRLLDLRNSDTPILQMWETDTPIVNGNFERTLQYFKINNGEYIEQGSESRSVKVSNGIDPFTGREFSQKSSPSKTKNALRRTTADALFEEPMSFRVSLSKTQAKAHSAGYAALVRYNIPAKAVAIGDPRIRPYSLVSVEGTGEQSDGYWLVDSVKHVFNKTGAYMAELKLLSDGTGKNKASSTRQATVGITGTVNLVEVLRKKKSSLAAVSKSTLNSKTALIKETGQGFNRTPARWKATRKK